MGRTVVFTLAGMIFEYDEEKNQINLEKHKISLKAAARVFFDDNCIEQLDTSHSIDEERYLLIGDLSAGEIPNDDLSEGSTILGNVGSFSGKKEDILYVVYTERVRELRNGTSVEVIRLISARIATNFERGLYYGQFI